MFKSIGVYRYNDKSKYEGEWKDDMRHGEGNLNYDNKNKYEGRWIDNEKNGQGNEKSNFRNFLLCEWGQIRW